MTSSQSSEWPSPRQGVMDRRHVQTFTYHDLEIIEKDFASRTRLHRSQMSTPQSHLKDHTWSTTTPRFTVWVNRKRLRLADPFSLSRGYAIFIANTPGEGGQHAVRSRGPS